MIETNEKTGQETTEAEETAPQVKYKESSRWREFNERFSPSVSVPLTEYGKNYAKHLKKPVNKTKTIQELLNKVDQTTARPQKRVIQKMDFNQGRKIFWRILKQRAAAEDRIYIVDNHNKEVIINLIKYVIGDKTGQFNARKGLFLIGGVGTGKTFLMDSIRTFYKITQDVTIKKVVCQSVVDSLQTAKNGRADYVLKRNYGGYVFFDDFGDEPAKYMDYGNPIYPMERILSERYIRWTNGALKTFVTSNLIGEEVKKVYGDRLHSRIKGMFNIIQLGGGDRR